MEHATSALRAHHIREPLHQPNNGIRLVVQVKILSFHLTGFSVSLVKMLTGIQCNANC